MKAAVSSREVGVTSMLTSARRALISGTASVLTSVACSLARIGCGVAAGAHAAYHTATSNPAKPDSATVGTFGNCALRAYQRDRREVFDGVVAQSIEKGRTDP